MYNRMKLCAPVSSALYIFLGIVLLHKTSPKKADGFWNKASFKLENVWWFSGASLSGETSRVAMCPDVDEYRSFKHCLLKHLVML